MGTPDEISQSAHHGKHASAFLSNDTEKIPPDTATQVGGLQFWFTIAAVCTAGLLSGSTATLKSITLPAITDDVGRDPWTYLIIIGVYTCSMIFSAPPIFTQLSSRYNGRTAIIAATGIFTLGASISVRAGDFTTMIVGQMTQAFGHGGIQVLMSDLIWDVVPVGRRMIYMSFAYTVMIGGACMGINIGGIFIQEHPWQCIVHMDWVLGVIVLVLFLPGPFRTSAAAVTEGSRDRARATALTRNIITFMLFTSCACRFLGWSWTFLVCLLMSLLALLSLQACEYIDESSPEPIRVGQLFNRTAWVSYFQSHFVSMCYMCGNCLIPFYLQVAQGSRSWYSLSYLTISLLMFIARLIHVFWKILKDDTVFYNLGRHYRIHQAAGYALMILGGKLITSLDETSSTAAAFFYPVIELIGLNIVFSTVGSNIYEHVTDDDDDDAPSIWHLYLLGHGYVCGYTLSIAIFNHHVDGLMARIDDPETVATLSERAFEHTTVILPSLSPAVRSQVVSVILESLRATAWVPLVVAGTAIALALGSEMSSAVGRYWKQSPSRMNDDAR